MLVVGLIYYTIRFVVLHLRYRHVPGYTTFFPLFINAFLHGEEFVIHAYNCSMKAFLANPDCSVVKTQLGTDVNIFVARDKEVIKEVLVKKYKSIGKGESMKPMALFGDNLFTSDSNSAVWKKHRTLANPIFTSAAHLKNVCRVTQEELPKMIEFWKRIYKNDQSGSIYSVNITEELTSIALTVINRVAFDYDMEIFSKTAEHRNELQTWIHNLITGVIFKFVLPQWCYDYLPFGIFKKFNDAKNRFRDAALTMILKKSKEIETDCNMKDDEDLLSLLLKSTSGSEEEKLTNDELISAIYFIFFAGFEVSMIQQLSH